MVVHGMGRIALCLAVVGFLNAVACLGFSQEAPHLYVFSMPTCVPCRQMEPDVDRLIRAGYPVSKVDCAANEAWAKHFQITQVPTTILVVGQQVASRSIGPQNYDQLVALFDSAGFRPGAAASASGQSAVVSQLSAETSLAPTRNAPPANGSTARWTEPKHLAHQATVRIKVEDPEGTSYATGTVIHRHGDEYLAITCGHVFRESHGSGTITVETGFAAGQPEATRGQLLRYESEARDVGLITFHSPRPIEPVRVAPQTMPIATGDEVFSMGCDHGADPSLRDTQILRSAVYDGAKKYDIVGRPVDGRSGGGLFSAGGQLIGVCNAAAVEVDEGVYSSLENIYWQFADANLAHLFQANAATAVATRDSAPPAAATIARQPEPVPLPAATEQVQGDVEIIMVVRSKQNPGMAETYSVQQPTVELLNLVQSMRLAESSASRTAALDDHALTPVMNEGEISR